MKSNGAADSAIWGWPIPPPTSRPCASMSADAKLIKTGAKAAKDGPVTVTGNYSFAGVEDKYFVAAFLPQPNPCRWP